MSERKAPPARIAARLVYATIGGSLLVSAALVLVHLRSGSQLALAQAADSFADTMSGLALVWAVRQKSRPADEEHPLGHARAEPIAALVVAVLAGVLAIEVGREAVTALATGATPELEWPVAVVFATKVAFKSTIATLAWRAGRSRHDPTRRALLVDARNDVLVGLVALAGYGLARFGLPALDAWLAIGVAFYVAFAAVSLGRENVQLLMGTAAEPAQREALMERARRVDGVQGIDVLVATWAGTGLHVHCDIVVDPGLSLRAAHDIGHAVEAALMQDDDVIRAVVHVGPREA